MDLRKRIAHGQIFIAKFQPGFVKIWDGFNRGKNKCAEDAAPSSNFPRQSLDILCLFAFLTLRVSTSLPFWLFVLCDGEIVI